MTYQQTLNYLFQQLPMFQRVGAMAFKKDLTNIKALCKLLGNPQERFLSIHLAGTNGKGSTAHILAAVLQAHGLKVGVHTSPHYRDFRERIKINGELAAEQFVIDFVEKYKEAWQDIQPSFFELAVAMAFQYFAEQKVEVAIIETGLGGRLDSTNIITPILSVITNISYDHQQFLGDTLPEIAGEKAGIIKRNVPVVIGEKQEEVTHVFEEKAKKENAPIQYASDCINAHFLDNNLHHSTFDIYKNDELWYEKLEVNLIGNYQRLNLQTALQALELLPSNLFELEEQRLREGLKNLKKSTHFLGRWQVLSETPLILADSAHNEAGIRSVMQYLYNFSFAQLHIVLGFANDKDLDKVLPLFPKNAIYYFVKADVPRGLNAQILMEKAKAFDLLGQSYASVKIGLESAKKSAKEKDLIYVGGSIFVLAEVV
ncbi:MAG: folylpolyglutamate synthase/dihydrofolate synthase family protein [Bacteroidota bacterium]